MRHLLFALLLLTGTAAAKPGRQFLVLTDIHFNPLADPALASQLMAVEPDQWEGVLAGSSRPPKYGEDSNWSLLQAMVAEVSHLEPRPKLILVTGDVMPHRFQTSFAAVTHVSDPIAFRGFAKKTFAFVSLQLEKAAQGVPVVYTVGNNDEYCEDYALQPGGPFLEDTEQIVQKLARDDAPAMQNWRSLGGFVSTNPLAAHHRIIALNTNFWSSRYVNACGDKSDASAEAVMKWLAGQLEDAQQHGDKVWLVYHIPPGIDGFSSARAGKVMPFWKPAYSDAFQKLLDQYHRTIELNLAAHTHLDDIRLIKTEHAETLILMNPAISPNISQNPAFRLYTTDRRARIQDATTYFMPSLEAAKWQVEYSFRSAYGLKKLDAHSYDELHRQIEQSPELEQKWTLYYSVSRAASLNSAAAYQRAQGCATWNAEAEAFQQCLLSESRLGNKY